MFHTIPDLIRTLAAFAVVLGVLVSVHEFGHYLAARWRGVAVEVFSVGFGRSLTHWVDRHGTIWRIAWLPLGGYVKMHGQERPDQASPSVRASWVAGRTFHEKSVLSRAIIVAAGPVANFVLAMVLFAALFATMGRPVTLPVVGGVLSGSAAERAGLQANDRIDSISGRPVQDFEDVQRIVTAHPDETLSIVVTRAGQPRRLEARIGSQQSGGNRTGILGIRAGTVEYQHLGLPAALWGGVTQTWDVTTETLRGVAQIIAGKRGTEDLGGPLRIAQLSGQVVQLGLASLVSFIAVLSVNLGLINLFPIPVLDGGHLLFYIAEAIRGRPLPPRAQEYGFRAGLALLASLFIFATWNDLSNVGLFRWVAHWLG